MSGPLKSLKILDFSTLLPGPYASMMLADMGADVLRIESPTRFDLVRFLPPMDGATSASHAFLNRGKRSLALDLKKQGAVDIIKKLISEYDVVLEQFRPGVMERLGLGYSVLSEINPSLIYCSITGYGQTGPYKQRAGHDINYLALAGVSGYSGRKEQGPPPLGIQVADVAGGSHHAVMGVLAAVIHRQQTGEGQFVDISMTDAAFAMNGMSGAGYLAAGVEPQTEEGVLNGGSFYDYYETKDHRYLAVGGLEPAFMTALCDVLERPDLVSIGLSQKQKDQQEFKSFLTSCFKQHDYQHWLEVFKQVDACVEPVLSFAESAQHPQLRARDMVIEVARPDGSMQQQIGHPIKFSATQCESAYIGGGVGQHTDEVLLEQGFSEADIKQYREQKLFG
ncbi:CaiB/BaiF CoA transferase family protein [Alkalimarinus sediminis]|uniref:CoA transferase n=1 Tax=Alkalimarinus sediminis TaxID=1632866 RepID=A0A9E8KK33_9ALTE|nr:CaiB/BaiF CoA-transferase family protein [Alkalimarinus sediminis]UZW75681.1 CoA transferase [Alkalimarinus sediminis]